MSDNNILEYINNSKFIKNPIVICGNKLNELVML